MTEPWRVSDMLLERYLANDLDAEKHARVAEAIKNQPELQARVAALQADTASFHAANPPEPFAHMVATQAAHRRGESLKTPWWRRAFVPALVSATAACALVIVLLRTADDPLLVTQAPGAVETSQIVPAKPAQEEGSVPPSELAGEAVKEEEKAREDVGQLGGLVADKKSAKADDAALKGLLAKPTDGAAKDALGIQGLGLRGTGPGGGGRGDGAGLGSISGTAGNGKGWGIGYGSGAGGLGVGSAKGAMAPKLNVPKIAQPSVSAKEAGVEAKSEPRASADAAQAKKAKRATSDESEGANLQDSDDFTKSEVAAGNAAEKATHPSATQAAPSAPPPPTTASAPPKERDRAKSAIEVQPTDEPQAEPVKANSAHMRIAASDVTKQTIEWNAPEAFVWLAACQGKQAVQVYVGTDKNAVNVASGKLKRRDNQAGPEHFYLVYSDKPFTVADFLPVLSKACANGKPPARLTTSLKQRHFTF